MPIRSPRGRVDAYRSLWQWPLRSPVRLAITGVVVVALAVGAGVAAGALRGTSDDGPMSRSTATGGSATPGPSGRSSTGAGGTALPTALPPVTPLVPSTLPLSQAPPAALRVAAGWSAAWVDHPDGITSEQWLAGLRPLTTDEYLGVLANVDPANVPAARVTGAPRPVNVAPRSVRVEVPTDALTLIVLVVDTEDGWRVAGYDRA
ncbi:hypothetical protein ACVGVM_26975 [Pseudonocardia bannensis]|uniref:Uncharacterized protein n=1 Tax=Pseudonocardia bannensis TaxID=630973 RepID=A0A848DGT7_9PSEU|nr:hypothetical protein [Pseudonocardia bannensis]NMH91892.1 hypothetical protein [Pseudonocardia bannensis]